MMKFMFFKPQEFANKIGEIIQKEEGVPLSCTVGYSDTLQTDAIFIQRVHGEDPQEIAVETLLPMLNTHLNVSISNYDVFEVGDFGEGFALTLV